MHFRNISTMRPRNYDLRMPTLTNIDELAAQTRRWCRYQFSVPVRVTIEKPRHATLVNTRACHINDGGIAVHTHAELSLGTVAEIEFMPAAFDFPLTLRGVVRNRAGNEYGVEFLVTSAAENEHLAIFREILHSKAATPDA
jgi:PilZ domain